MLRIWTIVAIALLVAAGGAHAEAGVVDRDQRLTLAAEYLLRRQLPSGLFIYETDLSDGRQTDMNKIEPLNMLRQDL